MSSFLVYLVVLYRSLVLAQNQLPKFQQFVPAAICPPKLCSQRPSSFEFQFVSTKCAASRNFQGKRFKCNFEALKQGFTLIDKASRKGAHITFTDAKMGKVYFDDWVKLGETFRVYSFRGQQFPSVMKVEFFSGSRSENPFKLQSIRFQTSCLKNLALGDTFGGVKVVGLYYIDDEDFVCDFTTDEPSPLPSLVPSVIPTLSPSEIPSYDPSNEASLNPTLAPSELPSIKPSGAPSSAPSVEPSSKPSYTPSTAPSAIPSIQPSSMPATFPSAQPSYTPSSTSSAEPSSKPSYTPSTAPSAIPSIQPSNSPTGTPSKQSSTEPSSTASQSPS